MAKQVNYRQYHLERIDGSKTVATTTWLPEYHRGKKLEVGMQVTIKDHKTKEPLPGKWVIKIVSQHSVSEEYAKARAHKWSHYRAATDV